MSEIRVYKKDEARLILESDDDGALMEVSEHFCFFVPGYRFMPSYRNKMFDGKIRLFNRNTKILPYGLLANLADFAKKRNYTLNIEKGILQAEVPSLEDLSQFVLKQLVTTSRNARITPRDYQIEGFQHAIREGRSLLISPTGSGKSLIIYMILRWFLDTTTTEKVLIVVPTTSLCHQMAKDFADYSALDPTFDGDEMTSIIMSGYDKNPKKKRIKITLVDGSIREFWPSQLVKTLNRGDIKAKDLLESDEL